MIARTACLAIALCAAFGAHAIDRYRVWHDGREIDVVDVDGWAVYDGDILIGRTAQVLERSLREGPDGARIGSLAKSLTLGAAGGRWPRGTSGLFEMPYVIETDPDGTVPGAVAAFNDQLSGLLRAVPRTTEADYVAFTLSATDESGACFSSIGHVGGRQLIRGSHLCGSGTLVHEMGHAIGLHHEQNHGDYARYVQVDLGHVDPALASNYLPAVNQRDATPYDFGSIMHYSSTTFAREGLSTLETIPPGIGIGQRAGYSIADIDGIHRLYGAPPQAITVTTFPPGLQVLVDGSPVTAPATFNWTPGSTHTLDVPASAQILNGSPHVFGRWNIDRNGDLAARRTITVAPGDGSITAPATAPAVSTYAAAFVRYKEVTLTSSGNRAGIGGSVVATPLPGTLPGLAGTFYRERQAFSLDPAPAAGSSFASWGGAYFYLVAYTTPYRSPFRGPLAFSNTLQTPYEYRAAFVDYGLLQVRAQSQAGEVLGARATVMRGSAASTDERLPYAAVSWTQGQSGTLSMAAVQAPWATTLRYVFRDWDGDPSPMIAVTSPAPGEASRTVTANLSKQYQAFRQVIPSCAGSIGLNTPTSPWYEHGSSVPVQLLVDSGWILTRWEGSLSGTSLSATLVVNDFPNLVARLNTVSTPLAVTAIAPATMPPGSPATIDITGTGFTPSSEVYVSGVRVPAQFASATHLVAAAPSDTIPPSGLAIVTVTNRLTPDDSCSVSASGSVDVLSAATSSANVPGALSGLWWNAGESGWGIHFTQRANIVFAAWYTYNASGSPKWYVSTCTMPSGTTGTSGTCNGAIYEVSGPTFFGTAFNPQLANAVQNGALQVTFQNANAASMTYSGVSGQTRTVAIVRQPLASGATPPAVNYTDIWWAGASQSGWGMAITQQFSTMFLAWYVYDATGKPMWYVATCTLNGTTCSGDLLRTTGPAFGPTFDPNAVHVFTAGTVSVSFTDGNNATLGYTVNGVSGSKAITRQLF